MKQVSNITKLLNKIRQKTKRPAGFVVLLCFFSSELLFSSEALVEGKKLLGENKAADAIPLLYDAVSTESPDSHVKLYLGVAYCQIGKYTDAEQWLLNGKETSTVDKHLYLYNLGNVYFLQKRFEEAETAYTEALAVYNNYSPAVLNRANTYMHRKNHAAALEDYKLYLNLAPASPQKQDIQRLILLLVEEEYIRQVNRMQQKTRDLAGGAAAGGATGAGAAGAYSAGSGNSSGLGSSEYNGAGVGSGNGNGTGSGGNAGYNSHNTGGGQTGGGSGENSNGGNGAGGSGNAGRGV